MSGFRRRPKAGLWCSATATAAVVLAGYFVFESQLPDCGPPRNTTLGRIYWLVPIALLLLQGAVLVRRARRTRRSRAVTVALVVLATVVVLAGGVAIWLGFFIAGNCGE